MSTNNPHKYKVFISYKYHDADVAQLESIYNSDDNITTARSYVNYLEQKKVFDNIYKGEKDSEPLNNLSDDTIYEKLKTSLADSSITLVLISPNMKEFKSEKEQWIAREISYSLRETKRNGIHSRTNKVAGIILPDKNKSYDYLLKPKKTSKNKKNYVQEQTSLLFDIINRNRRNVKNFTYHILDDEVKYFNEEDCYIRLYTWAKFISDPNKILNEISEINADDYDLKVELKE